MERQFLANVMVHIWGTAFFSEKQDLRLSSSKSGSSKLCIQDQSKKEKTVTAKSILDDQINIVDIHDELISYFKGKLFQADQLKKSLVNWKSLISNKEILQIIDGDIIEFETTPPERHYSYNANFSE